METTKVLSIEALTNRVINKDGVTLEDLKATRKQINERIKAVKYAALSEAEREALKQFEAFSDERKEVLRKVDRQYFNANAARRIVQKELRNKVGYHKKRGTVAHPERAKVFATAKQLEKWDAFNASQFELLCKSHNSALKMLLQADKLPAKITPRAYIAGIMRGACLSTDAFSARMALTLPK